MSHHQADRAAYHADQHALQHEDPPDLLLPRAHRHQHRDVAVLLHHHHDQGDENIQRRYEFDQADHDDGHEPLHVQRAQELLVAFHPRGSRVAFAHHLLDVFGDFGRAIQIVHVELDLVDLVHRKRLLRRSHRHVRPVVIDVEEPGFKQTAHLDAALYWPYTHGQHFIGEQFDVIPHAHPQVFGHPRAQNYAGRIRVRIAQAVQRAGLQMPQGSAQRQFRIHVHAFDERPLLLQRPAQEGGIVQHRRNRRHVRHLAQPRHHVLPVLDAVAGSPRYHVDVRHGAQQIALQRVAEPVGHGQGHHERGHAGRDAQHGNRRDDGDHRLLAARAQIASGDEQLEAPHSLSSSRRFPIRSMGPSGRSKGNRMTSRMEREPVRIMVNRSIPMPSPPVGGMP